MGVGLWYGETLGARIWGRKCFQHEGGGARGCGGNCRGPELGSGVDSSGEQESREAKHVASLVYGIVVQEEFVGYFECGRGSCM